MIRHLFGSWPFRLFLWLGFPTLILVVALHIGLSASLDSARGAAFERLEEDFSRIQEETDPKVFFLHELDEMFGALRGLAARQDAVDAVLKGFSKTWPAGSIDIHVFDGGGRMLSWRTSPPEIQAVMDLIRPEWTTPLDLPASLTQHLSTIVPAAGPIIRAMKGRPGTVVPLGGGRTFSWGFHRFQAGITSQRIAGMLVFIHQQRLSRDFIASRALERLGLDHARIAEDEQDTVELPGFDRPLPLSELRQAQARAADDHLAFGNRLVVLKRLDDTTLAVLSTPDPGHPRTAIILFAFIYFILFLTIAIAGRKAALRDGQLRIPVWGKLTLFFGFGFGFPLILSIALGQLYLSECREGMREVQRQEAFRQLSAVDSGFAPYVTRRRLFYSRLCRSIERRLSSSGLDLSAFDELYADFRFDNIQVVASSGRALRRSRLVLADLRRTLSLPRHERLRRFEQYIERGLVPNAVEADAICRGAKALEFPDAEDTGFESTVNRVAVQAAKLSIDQYNIDHGMSGARQTSNADLVVEGAMEDDAKELMQGARTGMRKMISLSSGNSIGMMYLDVLAGPGGEAWYALFIMHNLLTLQMDYLATLFDNAGSDGYAPVPASSLRIRAVSTHHMGRSYPGETEHRTFSGPLGIISRAPGAVTRTVEVDGKPHLVCARPATGLRHFVLIATIPLSALEQAFSAVRLRVWGGITALALFGLAVLVALWYRVVSPIAAVSEGLRAMRAGVFDRPVPVTGEDELGHMCSAINLAMGRLREMELARTVQADLLPHERLDLGSFVLQGRNRMTKAVGGDYFDFIPLHRGLTAVILGDVSGHGVSAALVTAMAKAAFTILCPRFPDQPEEVLLRLNRLMLTLLNRAKMMSCFLGIIDTQTGRLMAANAGQSYPILLPAAGAASLVSMPSQPLGTRAKAIFKRLDIDLREAGLLLYSDGMVEALNPDRKMFGYEGLVDAATEIWQATGRRATAEADLLTPFFDRLQKHLESGSAGDDVTLVIIRPRD